MRKITDEEFKESMERGIEFQQSRNSALHQAAAAAMKRIVDERESILEAFIAQHGFFPDEVVQVEFHTDDGKRGWCVRKKKEGEP
jgi:hypothetical protein